MTRLCGRAFRGEKGVDSTSHGHWGMLIMLCAISQNGVNKQAALLIDGALCVKTFLAFTEQFLTPSLQAGQVVVMGPLSSYKIAGVREAIESVGCDLWYLLG